MSRSNVVMIQRREHWLVICEMARVTFDHEMTAVDLASSVFAWTESIGAKNASVVIAPASSSCFFASLRPTAEVDVRDRTALAFELEDHLPIDAESFVADYVISDDVNGRAVAAIAIEYEHWKPIAESFEAVGLPVRSIVPEAILVARSLIPTTQAFTDAQFMLVADGHIDSIGIRDERVVSWKHLPLIADGLTRHKYLNLSEQTSILVVGDETTEKNLLTSIFGDVENVSGPIEKYAMDGAASYLADRGGPWFDLRRDQLAPTDRFRAVQWNLRALAIAASLLLLVLAVGGWYRSGRIESEVASIRDRQQSLFEKAYPETKVPGAILKRVRSEHAKMMGSRGAASVDVPTPAATVLRALLASLPPETRFQIQSLSINNGQVDLDLLVRSPVDAGAIATALSKGGFDVDPPITTQKDAQVFLSAIEAKWIGVPPLVAVVKEPT